MNNKNSLRRRLSNNQERDASGTFCHSNSDLCCNPEIGHYYNKETECSVKSSNYIMKKKKIIYLKLYQKPFI
jgi:hypothetical protein